MHLSLKIDRNIYHPQDTMFSFYQDNTNRIYFLILGKSSVYTLVSILLSLLIRISIYTMTLSIKKIFLIGLLSESLVGVSLLDTRVTIVELSVAYQ